MGSSECRQNFSYDDIRDMVVEHRQSIETEFDFSQEETSSFDMTLFRPTFTFHQGDQCDQYKRCVLTPARVSIKALSRDKRDSLSERFEYNEGGSNLANIKVKSSHHLASSQATGLGSSNECPSHGGSRLTASNGHKVEHDATSVVGSPDRYSFYANNGENSLGEERSAISSPHSRWNSATNRNAVRSAVVASGVLAVAGCPGLDRPIRNSDIAFVSEYESLSHCYLQMGWLMLSGSGYMMKDIKNEILKDFERDEDSVKITHLIESWRRLRKEDATAVRLLDICCQVGGDRFLIEAGLNSVQDSCIGQLVDLPVNAVFCENIPTLEETAAHEVDHSWSEIPEQLIETIAKIAPDKWKVIGISLGVKLTTLDEYELRQDSTEVKVRRVIELEWKRRIGENGTIGCLLKACEKANVKPVVLEELRIKHNMTVRES